MNSVECFDSRVCELGEGPFWHPERGQIFWFDIIGKRLLARVMGNAREWHFDECVSACGWLDHDHILIASETALFVFNLESGGRLDTFCQLEANNPLTRCNDGRADPQGGFWIGTMGKELQQGAGAIYRWYKGKLEKLYEEITVPNTICFSPDGAYAYFSDTPTRKILRQPLDRDGWPAGKLDLFVDLTAERLNPDGAVVDGQGHLWNAQWGASRVARYSPDGIFVEAINFPAEQTSCPAFGGDDLKSLFVTSAKTGLSDDGVGNGQTFVSPVSVKGQTEHRVML